MGKQKSDEKGLTPKQLLFVQEYLVDLNATQAAIRAGYSEKTAYSIGHENLKKPDLAAAIELAFKARSKSTEITQEMVLAELGRVGFSNMTNYAIWNEHGVTLMDSDKLTDDAARCVAEVSQTVTAEGGTVKLLTAPRSGNRRCRKPRRMGPVWQAALSPPKMGRRACGPSDGLLLGSGAGTTRRSFAVPEMTSCTDALPRTLMMPKKKEEKAIKRIEKAVENAINKGVPKAVVEHTVTAGIDKSDKNKRAGKKQPGESRKRKCASNSK